MENKHAHQAHHAPTLTAKLLSATNVRFGAFADHQDIWIYDSASPTETPLRIHHGYSKKLVCLALAISSVPHNLLGLAKGHKIFVFDLSSCRRKTVLIGNGHNVTAISFSPQSPDVIATGTADGSVCLWSLKNAFHPLHSLHGFGGACQSITFNPLDSKLLSIGGGSNIRIWNTQSSKTIAIPIEFKHGIDQLMWPSADTTKLISVSKDGSLRVWDMQDLDSCGDQLPDRRFLHGPENSTVHQAQKPVLSCLLTFPFKFPVLQVELIGKTGLAVLPENGLLVLFYLMTADCTAMVEEWQFSSSHRIHAISIQFHQPKALLATYGPQGIWTYEIPRHVCENLGWSNPALETISTPKSLHELRADIEPPGAVMTPELISRASRHHPFHEPNSKGSLSRRLPMAKVDHRSVSRPSTAQSTTQTDVLALSSLTDSLELPKNRYIESDSLMPFLSPSIPAVREMPTLITALDESLQLPPLARASFNSTTTATANDSDSDDDALSGPLVSSGTLLPGGVNVPLPRSCGALFSPSGHLIVFLPSKPRPPSVVGEQQLPDSSPTASQELEVIRLFPTFGNLNRLSTSRRDDPSDSESTLSVESELVGAQRLGLQESSFDSRHHWNIKIQPSQTKVGLLPSETKIKVTTYDANELSLMRKEFAREYRLTSNEGETYTDLCRLNAEKATKAELVDVADVWTTLALGLHRDYSMASRKTGFQTQDLSAIQATTGFPFEYQVGLFEPGTWTMHSSLQLHPPGLENIWMVTKLISWAERRGDVQMLAYITIMVLNAWERAFTKDRDDLGVSLRPMIARDSAIDDDPPTRDSSRLPGPNTLMRANSTEQGLMNSSLFKGQIFASASRNPSQPATPYLHSALSTPPLILAASSRRNARLSSMSGSASPEHNRSSFSAAAKYYAQSITDKFASYGTSPPVRKPGTSPSLELSSSLPTTGQHGSWTKSVSFASPQHAATAAANDARRGLGIAHEPVDDSDSDRTIDEHSLPHTPKSPNALVPILWHPPQPEPLIPSENGSLESASSSESSKIFQELRSRSRVWCGYYAERLRAWDLMFEATELEKIAGVAAATTTTAPKKAAGRTDAEAGVRPYLLAGKRQATCNICYCFVRGAQQVCPACGHVAHPECWVGYLEGLMAAASAAVEFTCPAGCGCDCSMARERDFVDVKPRTRYLGKETSARRLRAGSLGEGYRV